MATFTPNLIENVPLNFWSNVFAFYKTLGYTRYKCRCDKMRINSEKTNEVIPKLFANLVKVMSI